MWNVVFKARQEWLFSEKMENQVKVNKSLKKTVHVHA